MSDAPVTPARKDRRADVRMALVLFAGALAMLLEASGYPMTDSYGGVQNVWYVSPALFPLAIGGLLALLSGGLLIYAVTRGAMPGWRGAFKPGRIGMGESACRTLMIVGLLAGLIFLLVPRIDFVIAGIAFLQFMLFAFYLDRRPLFNGAALAMTVLVVAVFAAYWLSGASSEAPSVIPDLTALVVIAVAGLSLARKAAALGAARKRLLALFSVSLGVPLVLAPLFKFGFLVPLPHEGVVIRSMESIRYALRALS